MHIYNDKDGNRYPSVTTVIHSILINPHPLLKWSNVMGFKRQEYEKIMEKTATIGTSVHNALDCYAKGTDNNDMCPFQAIDTVNAIMASAIPFLEKNGITKETTMLNEQSIVSPKLGYAGTIDWLGTLNDGKLTLIDYKTSKKVSISHEIQISAYAKLLEDMGIIINQGGIIILRPNGAKLYLYDKDFLNRRYKVFEHLLSIFNELNLLEELEKEEKTT